MDMCAIAFAPLSASYLYPAAVAVQWGYSGPGENMAEFNDLVSAVHAVYKQRGGSYDEGTAPQLMTAAKMLYDKNKEFVRAAEPDELRNSEQAIVEAIREAGR